MPAIWAQELVRQRKAALQWGVHSTFVAVPVYNCEFCSTAHTPRILNSKHASIGSGQAAANSKRRESVRRFEFSKQITVHRNEGK
jgi:hypothetical protein